MAEIKEVSPTLWPLGFRSQFRGDKLQTNKHIVLVGAQEPPSSLRGWKTQPETRSDSARVDMQALSEYHFRPFPPLPNPWVQTI